MHQGGCICTLSYTVCRCVDGLEIETRLEMRSFACLSYIQNLCLFIYYTQDYKAHTCLSPRVYTPIVRMYIDFIIRSHCVYMSLCFIISKLSLSCQLMINFRRVRTWNKCFSPIKIHFLEFSDI